MLWTRSLLTAGPFLLEQRQLPLHKLWDDANTLSVASFAWLEDLNMLDLFFRVTFYVVTGVALAGACAWYAQSLYHEVTGRGEVVIAPFEVVGSANNKDRGLALAHMLHARLREIERDMRVAQQELMGGHPGTRPAAPATMQSLEPAPAQAGMVATRIAMPQLLTQTVELRAGLLEPADINISVGGVQVGGVVAWMQRLMSNPRTLVFTLYERKDGAQVSGSLHALAAPSVATARASSISLTSVNFTRGRPSR